MHHVSIRTITSDTVISALERLIGDVCCRLPEDVKDALDRAASAETIPCAAYVLDRLRENAAIAAAESLPLCQDTGIAVFFADIGDHVIVEPPGLEVALQEATRRGYRAHGLRMSMTLDPLTRGNTGDNTPAIIHTRTVPGDSLTISFCPKGGGCENMSRIAMLSPGEGREGVVNTVVDTVRIGGGRPCPPVVVGVGIGGSFEYSAILAKRALLRSIGSAHPDPLYAALESELLERLNKSGVGPLGLGGDTTALAVFVEVHPCHIASLPVAVNIQCHSARHGMIVL